MIQLHIICKTKEDAILIAKNLYDTRLATDINFDHTFGRLNFVNDQPEFDELIEVTAKTKALLFNEIEKYIDDHFEDKVTEVFSTAIVHMNWKSINKMTKSVREV